MGLIVLVDVNGQRLESALTLAHFMEAMPTRKVFVSGAQGALEAWRDRLQRNSSQPGSIEFLRVEGRRDEATVLLSSRAIEFCLSNPDSQQDDWLIFSRREGFQALAQALTRLGVAQARWAPVPTPDFLRSLLSDKDQLGDAIREVAERLMQRHPGKPILIGTLANSLTELLPDLRSANLREELFGSRRFKVICTSVGLKVKGDHIYPTQRV